MVAMRWRNNIRSGVRTNNRTAVILVYILHCPLYGCVFKILLGQTVQCYLRG